MHNFLLRKVNWLTAVSMNYQKGQDRDSVVGTKKKGEMGDRVPTPGVFFVLVSC